MEVPQGNSLCGSFKQAKISFFPSYIFLIQNQRMEGCKSSCIGFGIGGRGRRWEMVKEGEYFANTAGTCM
jgi:hypothetical protein